MSASRQVLQATKRHTGRGPRSAERGSATIWRGFPPEMVRDIAAQRLRALSHPVRLEIVERLRAGPTAVSDLAAAIGREPDAVSKHLGRLASVRLVRREQRGNAAFYALSDEASVRIAAVMYRDVARDLHGLARLAGAHPGVEPAEGSGVDV